MKNKNNQIKVLNNLHKEDIVESIEKAYSLREKGKYGHKPLESCKFTGIEILDM